jgi:transposase
VVNHVEVPEESLSLEELRELLAQRDAQNAALTAVVVELTAQVAALTASVEALQRQLGRDSSNSSKPPSSDAPWAKPAPKRSSRSKTGRKQGKQPGTAGSWRPLADDPNETVLLEPGPCAGCGGPLSGVAVTAVQRRQVADVPEPAPVRVVEYRRISKCCTGCGTVTSGSWSDPKVDRDHVAIIAGDGSPVRVGPATLARCALLTCAHYLPVGRSREVLEALTGIDVSTGFLAGVRGRAARRLEKTFTTHMQQLLASAPVLHADETTGRAAGSLSYVHVACTEYLTLMHVGGRSSADIDAGGVLAEYTGVLVRDGYAGYAHLPAIHAWCGAHLLRDLRSISDADTDGQTWALAMAGALTDACHAAQTARAAGDTVLDPATLADLRNRYLGALVHGSDENRGKASRLARDARTLINRFRRYEDMILRFATDLTVPFTNNEAERTLRPVKIQQRTSGGAWRKLQGLIDFAVVTSYLDTAHKWGLDKLDALHQLFTTGPWLPPALTPSAAA